MWRPLGFGGHLLLHIQHRWYLFLCSSVYREKLVSCVIIRLSGMMAKVQGFVFGQYMDLNGQLQAPSFNNHNKQLFLSVTQWIGNEVDTAALIKQQKIRPSSLLVHHLVGWVDGCVRACVRGCVTEIKDGWKNSCIATWSDKRPTCIAICCFGDTDSLRVQGGI
jgi:hypothetical protein